MPEIKTELLFKLTLEVPPILVLGETPYGNRRIAQVVGGSFEGPKLKGRVLNREKINKSIDGLYFICFQCKKICHNLDEGWMEEAGTLNNYCGTCAKAKGIRSSAA